MSARAVTSKGAAVLRLAIVQRAFASTCTSPVVRGDSWLPVSPTPLLRRRTWSVGPQPALDVVLPGVRVAMAAVSQPHTPSRGGSSCQM